jgi:hypothetical protein
LLLLLNASLAAIIDDASTMPRQADFIVAAATPMLASKLLLPYPDSCNYCCCFNVNSSSLHIVAAATLPC